MKKILPLLLALTALAGCTKTAQTSEFDLAYGPTAFSADGGTLEATASWKYCRAKMTTDASFVKLPDFVYVGDESDEGTRSLTFTVAANDSPDGRTATVSFLDIGSGSILAAFTITQEGKPREVVTVKVDAGKTYQTWDGFGGMNAWGDTDYWSDSEADVLLGTLGLNIMRIRIPVEESHWQNLVPGCRYAVEKYGALLLASPWTMPVSMKTPGQPEASKNGVTSSLKRDCYEDYALYLERFASCMKEQGAPLYAISVQNEPDWAAPYEGCLWTADEHLTFVRDYGHLVTSARLVTGESLNFNHSFYDPVLKDATACGNIDIVGGHLYGSTPQTYHLAAEKGKTLWMTEHLLNDNWKTWDETMDMLTEIHNCLSCGFNAYIWWYARRYYSLIGDGDEGTARGAILRRGYAFGQYSRYIRPGDVRIGATASGTGAETLLATAFKGSDHTAVILLNTSDASKDVTVDLGAAASGAKATRTSADDNSEGVFLDTSGSSVSLSLPARSVTTLVL